MHILVLGGTQFVGRHFVEAALARGHQLTLLHRGRTGADLFGDSEHLIADRDVSLDVLRDRSFDATVDSSAYFPGQVRALAAVLGERAGHYLHVSSVSAYADPPGPGAVETAPLLELTEAEAAELEFSRSDYGRLKAASERAAVAAFATVPVTIVRPTYVVGPYDHTGRFTWWVDRISRGGVLPCPAPADAPLQLIDARDLAAWCVSLLENRTAGVFHAAAPQPPWSLGDMVGEIAAALPVTAFEPVWIDPAVVRGARARYPFDSAGALDWISAIDASAARAAGLSPRPFADTVRDTYAWVQAAHWSVAGVGVDSETEASLVAYPAGSADGPGSADL